MSNFYFSPKNTYLVSNFHFYSYTLVFNTNLTFRACSEILRMNMKSLLKRYKRPNKLIIKELVLRLHHKSNAKALLTFNAIYRNIEEI